MKWRDLIDRLTLTRVNFAAAPEDYDTGGDALREDVESLTEASVVNSKNKHLRCHAVLLDLDVPAWLIPSSSPGHSHLYASVACSEEDYFTFLDAAAKIGLIEEGYASVSKVRGQTSLRLPWVLKDGAPRREVVPDMYADFMGGRDAA